MIIIVVIALWSSCIRALVAELPSPPVATSLAPRGCATPQRWLNLIVVFWGAASNAPSLVVVRAVHRRAPPSPPAIFPITGVRSYLPFSSLPVMACARVVGVAASSGSMRCQGGIEGVGAVLNVSVGSVGGAQNRSGQHTPSNRHRPRAPSDSRWGKGRARGGGLSTRLDEGGVTIVAAAEKKVKYCCTMLCATHDFYSSCTQGKNRAMQSHGLVLPPCNCIARFATREYMLVPKAEKLPNR